MQNHLQKRLRMLGKEVSLQCSVVTNFIAFIYSCSPLNDTIDLQPLIIIAMIQ